MSDATLRAGIKALLDTVPAAGRIHDYDRWVVDQSKFLDLFKDPASGRIFGWEITRAGIPKVARITRKYKVTHSYLIKGYYGLQDAAATEKLFNAVIDAMVLKLLEGIPGTEEKPLPSVPVIQARTFGAVLCHYAEIRLDNVAEIVSAEVAEETTDLLRVGLNYYLTPGDDDVDATDLVDLPELPKQ